MYLLFDIGGTKMRLGVSEDLERLGRTAVVETPTEFEPGLSKFLEEARALSEGKKFHAIAGGIAGPLDKRKGALLGGPNLQGWIGKPLKDELEKQLGAPTMMENDTAMVGLGEAWRGAGRGHRIVMYITVSTGVGGVRIVHGNIDEKTIGFEPGHQVIDAGRALCPECGGAYLVDYISGAGIKKRFGKRPEDIHDPEIWDRIAYFLAYGINNSIVHWSPDIVVMGGSLMKKIPLEKVKAYVRSILAIFPEAPEMRLAELGDVGGLYGAMVFLKGKGI